MTAFLGIVFAVIVVDADMGGGNPKWQLVALRVVLALAILACMMASYWDLRP